MEIYMEVSCHFCIRNPVQAMARKVKDSSDSETTSRGRKPAASETPSAPPAEATEAAVSPFDAQESKERQKEEKKKDEKDKKKKEKEKKERKSSPSRGRSRDRRRRKPAAESRKRKSPKTRTKRERRRRSLTRTTLCWLRTTLQSLQSLSVVQERTSGPRGRAALEKANKS